MSITENRYGTLYDQGDLGFDTLNKYGLIDLYSDAWRRKTNARKALCGRCGNEIAPLTGKPYYEQHGGWRGWRNLKFLCDGCDLIVR